MSEDSIGGALGVSRNTLREAFRLLTHERLLVHELNRGVFVRVLTIEDVEDIYRTRTLVECAVVSVASASRRTRWTTWHRPSPTGSGRRAKVTGKASVRPTRFPRELVALAGSDRTDELMRSVFAELRLAFHVVADPRRLHQQYLTRNHEILKTLRAGDRDGAERLLAVYLDDSLTGVVEAYARRVADAAQGIG